MIAGHDRYVSTDRGYIHRYLSADHGRYVSTYSGYIHRYVSTDRSYMNHYMSADHGYINRYMSADHGRYAVYTVVIMLLCVSKPCSQMSRRGLNPECLMRFLASLPDFPLCRSSLMGYRKWTRVDWTTEVRDK